MKAANVTIIPQFDEDILQGFGEGGGAALHVPVSGSGDPPTTGRSSVVLSLAQQPSGWERPTISTTSAREAGERKGEEVSGC